MGHLKDFLAGLPDRFNKSENSNIGKLLTIISEQMDSLTQTFLTIEEWRSIDKAEGTTLDLLGDDYNLKRGQDTDSAFRVTIRGKQARVNSDGSINKIIQAIAASLGRTLSDIQIQNGYELDEPETAMMVITIKSNADTNELPFPKLEDVIAGAIGVRWQYVIERETDILDDYSRWIYPFENYTGQYLAGDEAVSNDNKVYISSEELSGFYTSQLNEYSITGDFTLGNNSNSDYVSNFELSFGYYSKLQNYQICGDYVAGG